MGKSGIRVLGIIPARGGSKGLPGKNVRSFLGHPLVAWSIAQAKESGVFAGIVLSTDSEEIASVGRRMGLDIDGLRPNIYSTDTASTVDVVDYELKKYEFSNGKVDYICLIEPTSPLRKKSDFSSLVTRLVGLGARYDAAVTVGEVPLSVELFKAKDGDLLKPYISNVHVQSRRQDLAKTFFPYGVAYLIKRDVFLSGKTFYPDKLTYLEIEAWQNFEIDNLFDFEVAEAVAKIKGFKL
jgi:CMP-N,N'-diacetyllegionaminic acid synthase